jgi:hypothetical protein
MTKFHVAHFNEQGEEIIAIPLDSAFEHKSQKEKDNTLTALQICATSAGLAGTVVLLWEYGSQVKFIAPKPWHPFFQSQGIYQRILASRNKELTCQ